MQGPLFIALLAVTCSSAAAANRDDWRLYGLAETDVRFYSVPSVVRSPENVANPKAGTVRVWTQRIALGPLRQAVAAMKKDSLLVQTATARASAHYMPPFFTVFSLPADQDRAVLRAGVIVYEEAANQGLVPAEVAILWELDCENGRQRVLESISFATHGEAPNVDTVPSSWSYFAPHSMGEDMQTLLCDKKLTAPDNTPATQKPTS